MCNHKWEMMASFKATDKDERERMIRELQSMGHGWGKQLTRASIVVVTIFNAFTLPAPLLITSFIDI